MDRKKTSNHVHYHAVAMFKNKNNDGDRHAAVFVYMALRARRGRRLSRALMHWMLFKIAVKRLWRRLVVLPYLKRFRPERVEQLRKLYERLGKKL